MLDKKYSAYNYMCKIKLIEKQKKKINNIRSEYIWVAKNLRGKKGVGNPKTV